MRDVCIPALLFATYTCVAQARTPADELQTSLLRGNLLWIGDGQPRLESTITICLAADPNHLIVGAAETLTNRMFASIRLKLQWDGPPVCPAAAGDPIFLIIQTRTPEAHFPGALGVALPLEGSHAWVFYDRVRRSTPGDDHLPALLAHVMAHEIAHVLQGVIRHSDSGILKAQWSATDCARMTFFPLIFTAYDATLIHLGIEERRLRLSTDPFGLSPANRSGAILSAGRGALALP